MVNANGKVSIQISIFTSLSRGFRPFWTWPLEAIIYNLDSFLYHSSLCHSGGGNYRCSTNTLWPKFSWSNRAQQWKSVSLDTMSVFVLRNWKEMIFLGLLFMSLIETLLLNCAVCGWLMTCPVLLVLLSNLAGESRYNYTRSLFLLLANQAMILAGATSSFATYDSWKVTST